LSKSASRARLAEIIRKRSFGRGEITLASGRKSDFYFNLKPTMLDPEGAALLAELTYEALKDDRLDYVGGWKWARCRCRLDRAAVLAQGPSDRRLLRAQEAEGAWRPSRRRGPRQGRELAGKRVVIVEDVTTTGDSALKAVEAVRDAGGEIVLVFTMIDRDEGAAETSPRPALRFARSIRPANF
jgi:Orotate phosphoribosyltransferase